MSDFIFPTTFSNVVITTLPSGVVPTEELKQIVFTTSSISFYPSNFNLFNELERLREDAEKEKGLLILYQFIASWKPLVTQKNRPVLRYALKRGFNFPPWIIPPPSSIQKGDLVQFTKQHGVNATTEKGIYLTEPKLADYNYHSIYSPTKNQMINSFRIRNIQKL